MRSYTAHLKSGRPPVLLREGFAWGAALFGPLWFAAHRAWWPALGSLVLAAMLGALAGPIAAPILATALAVITGLVGRDLVRWSLEQRGYLLEAVLAARDEDAALGRLLTWRPDLAAGYAAILA